MWETGAILVMVDQFDYTLIKASLLLAVFGIFQTYAQIMYARMGPWDKVKSLQVCFFFSRWRSADTRARTAHHRQLSIQPSAHRPPPPATRTRSNNFHLYPDLTLPRELVRKPPLSTHTTPISPTIPTSQVLGEAELFGLILVFGPRGSTSVPFLNTIFELVFFVGSIVTYCANCVTAAPLNGMLLSEGETVGSVRMSSVR